MTSRDFLAANTIHSLVEKKFTLVEVNDNSTIGETLELLRKLSLTTVPVYSHLNNEFLNHYGSTRTVAFGENDKVYVGVVSMLEIALYLLSDTNLAKPIEFSLAQPIREVVKLKDTEPLTFTSPDASLMEVIETFAKEEVHRLLVSLTVHDAEGDITPEYRILTQTDVIGFITSNVDRLGSFVDCSVEYLGMITPALSIPSNQSITCALRTMSDAGLYAVPLVDVESGSILSTLSVSDLRGLTPAYLATSLPGMTALEFLRSLYTTIPRPIVCTRETSFRDVLQLLFPNRTNRVHRIWVVDVAMRPVGVVSMTDIIMFLSKLPAP